MILNRFIYKGLANLFQNGSDLFQKQTSTLGNSSTSTSTSTTTTNTSTSSAYYSLTSSFKNDTPDQMKAAVLDWFQVYIGELAKDIQTKIGSEWNGGVESAQASALTSCFITFVRRLNLPLKQVGKVDIDKIPVFVMSKKAAKSGKKPSTSQITVKGHCFVDCAFLSVRSVCVKCSMPFWGIGYQGMICQSMIYSFF